MICGPEKTKLLLSIERQDDIEQLRSLAKDLACVVSLMAESPNNYSVMLGDSVLRTGSKDWCIGFAEGREEYASDEYGPSPPCTVRCGEFQVWPDWGVPKVS